MESSGQENLETVNLGEDLGHPGCLSALVIVLPPLRVTPYMPVEFGALPVFPQPFPLFPLYHRLATNSRLSRVRAGLRFEFIIRDRETCAIRLRPETVGVATPAAAIPACAES